MWPVRSLDVPDDSLRNVEQVTRVASVQLLLDRARAVRPDLEVGGDDVTSVVQICQALDGMPLAIELAAGRLRSLSLTDLATRLRNQPALLNRQRSTGRDDSRHQSLRMTLDWSYDLLSEEQQTLARRLSVFAGGFRLDAAQEVCGGDVDVLDGVDEMVAKSLVSFDGTARYRLLEPIRQYLAERLDEAGATEVVQRAHAEWVVGLCDRLGTRLLEDQRSRSMRLGEEASNVELALRWAHVHDHAMAIRIVGSLGQYWLFYDQTSGRRWCEVVIEASADVAPRPRAKALLSAGMIAQNDRVWNRSVARLREALGVYRAEGAVAGQAVSLFWLGRVLANWWVPEDGEDHAMEATRCFQDGHRLFTQLGDCVGAEWCRVWLSSQALWNDDLEQAERLSHQVIEECDAAGVRHPVGQALCNLALIARRRRHDDAALEFLQDAVALYRDLDDVWQLTGVLVELATQQAAMGRGTEALQALAESSRLDQQIGGLPEPERAFRLAVAAVVHLARGQPDLAIAALGAYDAHQLRDTHPPRSHVGGYLGSLADSVEITRARLDPTKLAAATGAARRKSVEELIDELIIQPATVPG
jgi:hypothetical protein